MVTLRAPALKADLQVVADVGAATIVVQALVGTCSIQRAKRISQVSFFARPFPFRLGLALSDTLIKHVKLAISYASSHENLASHRILLGAHLTNPCSHAFCHRLSPW